MFAWSPLPSSFALTLGTCLFSLSHDFWPVTLSLHCEAWLFFLFSSYSGVHRSLPLRACSEMEFLVHHGFYHVSKDTESSLSLIPQDVQKANNPYTCWCFPNQTAEAGGWDFFLISSVCISAIHHSQCGKVIRLRFWGMSSVTFTSWWHRALRATLPSGSLASGVCSLWGLSQQMKSSQSLQHLSNVL